MTTEEQTTVGATPRGNVLKTALHRYGLGGLFAANVLGAGSVYILSQTGASVGFALLWVLPLAFALDMVMHDMSSRMATDGRPLMTYISSVIGHKPGIVFAIVMALVMQLWAVANYAVAGAVLAWFMGADVALLVMISGLLGAMLVASGTYSSVEAVISAMLVFLFSSYFALVFGINVPMNSAVLGLVPGGISDATLVIAMLGTTVYYPNFFIQSSMRPTKGWIDIKKYRRDNAVGIAFAVIVSAAILTVAATTLTPGEISLTAPGEAVAGIAGDWALPLFMVAVFAASFTSATGTLFGSGFAVPQSFGYATEFDDTKFSVTVVLLVLLSSVLAVLALEFTNLTPVRMAIVMPALNGAIFLPVTIVAMFAATRDELPTWQQTVTSIAVVVMFGGSVLTAQSLAETIMRFI